MSKQAEMLIEKLNKQRKYWEHTIDLDPVINELKLLTDRVKQLEALGSHAANEMIKTIEEKTELNNQFRETNAALGAQLNAIKHVALELSGVISDYEQMSVNSLRVRMFNTNRHYMKRISETPAQCLAEVQAQASKDGYVAALITHTEEPTAWCNEQASKHYGQLRQQAKVN